MSRLRAVLWLNLIPQALLGVGGFALAPEAVLPELGASGQLALRLAAFSNVPQVIFSLYALRRGDEALLRLWVLALLSYHALAGAQAVLVLGSQPDTPLALACRGPAVFHAIFALTLGLGAWPRERARS